jgi:hypothetical protein
MYGTIPEYTFWRFVYVIFLTPCYFSRTDTSCSSVFETAVWRRRRSLVVLQEKLMKELKEWR